MIEFAALLLISMLFGGMTLYSFGFAPMVFSAMPADDAGRFIRAAFLGTTCSSSPPRVLAARFCCCGIPGQASS
jgi:hypothetical protein